MSSDSSTLLTGVSQAIKEVQRDFVLSSQDVPLGDDRTSVVTLCAQLDALLRNGLLKKYTKQGFWPFAKEISHSDTIHTIEHLGSVATDIGRGRAWIRLALNETLMETYFINIDNLSDIRGEFYMPNATVNDSEVMSTVTMLLSGLEMVKFNISLNTPTLDPIKGAGGHVDYNPNAPVVPSSPRVIRKETRSSSFTAKTDDPSEPSKDSYEAPDLDDSMQSEEIVVVSRRKKKKKKSKKEGSSRSRSKSGLEDAIEEDGRSRSSTTTSVPPSIEKLSEDAVISPSTSETQSIQSTEPTKPLETSESSVSKANENESFKQDLNEVKVSDETKQYEKQSSVDVDDDELDVTTVTHKHQHHQHHHHHHGDKHHHQHPISTSETTNSTSFLPEEKHEQKTDSVVFTSSQPSTAIDSSPKTESSETRPPRHNSLIKISDEVLAEADAAVEAMISPDRPGQVRRSQSKESSNIRKELSMAMNDDETTILSTPEVPSERSEPSEPQVETPEPQIGVPEIVPEQAMEMSKQQVELAQSDDGRKNTQSGDTNEREEDVSDEAEEKEVKQKKEVDVTSPLYIVSQWAGEYAKVNAMDIDLTNSIDPLVLTIQLSVLSPDEKVKKAVRGVQMDGTSESLSLIIISNHNVYILKPSLEDASAFDIEQTISLHHIQMFSHLRSWQGLVLYAQTKQQTTCTNVIYFADPVVTASVFDTIQSAMMKSHISPLPQLEKHVYELQNAEMELFVSHQSSESSLQYSSVCYLELPTKEVNKRVTIENVKQGSLLCERSNFLQTQWRAYPFTLKGQSLTMWSRKEENVPKAKFDINSPKFSCRLLPEKDGHYCFEICGESKEAYILGTLSKTERNSWVRVLQSHPEPILAQSSDPVPVPQLSSSWFRVMAVICSNYYTYFGREVVGDKYKFIPVGGFSVEHLSHITLDSKFSCLFEMQDEGDSAYRLLFRSEGALRAFLHHINQIFLKYMEIDVEIKEKF